VVEHLPSKGKALTGTRSTTTKKGMRYGVSHLIRRTRQEDYEFKASLGYLANPASKKKKKKNKHEAWGCCPAGTALI
jgi:hypothetical protein